jgi:hypothetical protein
VKTSELRLQEAIRESEEEEIQMHACELFTLVDAPSQNAKNMWSLEFRK